PAPMPSIEHNALVQLFRDNPALVPRLLDELFGVVVPPHATVTVVEASLDLLKPIEFRADLALELRDVAGRIVFAAVLEAQLSDDPDKKYSWPVYVTVLRARKRCPAAVLVVAPDEHVAAWAAQPIQLGPTRDMGMVRPLVLGPAQLPRITDIDSALRVPELAVLSARAHGNGPDGLAVLAAAMAGLEVLEPEAAGVYFHVIYEALRDPVRRAMEAMVMSRMNLPKIPLPQYVLDLHAEMRAHRAQGKAEGMREVLLDLAGRTGVPLSSAAIEQITACSDIATLKRWIENALTARTTDELLA
ncbi:MAG TPA: hypothetical protein VLS89_03680, partial [Candidatus Nanopelagicales bacterium]|nr:hypothetical protein [Candidatus Nanopelagicales bacterium]